MARDRGTLTYEAYAALPDDGKRYEIHGGELSVTPAPSSRHELVSGNLCDLLRRHVTPPGSATNSTRRST